MNHPHDNFCKKTLRNRNAALSFFREYLPKKVVEKIDWRTLKISKETFVTSEMKDRFSDLLYMARMRGNLIYIYILFEHQSTVDFWMGLRLLRYMLEIWELFREQNPDENKLPKIFPMVLYHGKNKWNVKTNFIDLFNDTDDFEKYIPDFHYELNDLSSISDSEIKGTIIVRLFLTFLKHIFSDNHSILFERMIPLIVELAKTDRGMDYIRILLTYLCETSDSLSLQEVEQKLVPLLEKQKRGDIMTIADRLRQEGEKKV